MMDFVEGNPRKQEYVGGGGSSSSDVKDKVSVSEEVYKHSFTETQEKSKVSRKYSHHLRLERIKMAKAEEYDR